MHLRWLLALACLLLAACAPSLEGRTDVVTFERAQAVRGDWNDTRPPVTGWTNVTLQDDWTARWPRHDGVVWYRVRWQQSHVQPTGLLLPYVCLADAVYINGSQLHRDPQLVEPLSRSWTRPQYFLLDAPLLKSGQNELLVRVSGLSAYQPGLGEIHLGTPQLLTEQFRHATWLRHDAQLVNRCIGAVLGGLFLMLWLLRRRDTLYGWFALSAIFSAIYGWNFVADGIWPFRNTDQWAAVNIAAYFAGAICQVMFLLRYCDLRRPWSERVLLLLGAASWLLAFALPSYLGPQRDPWVLLGTVIYYASMIAFIVFAVRRGRMDQRILAACLALQLLVSLHDLALFFGLIQDDTYLLSLTSPLNLLGIGFVLTFRYAQALRRMEGFNIELRQEVDQATQQLGQTLNREHVLALENTRIGERLNLVRDLHDGFGGTLIGTIASLEQSDAPSDPRRIAAVLKDMRDDLRLVIDTTTQAQDGAFGALLAPLRHRWTQRLEGIGIDAHWQVQALETLQLSPNTSLDLMRLLQEALTNVYKHSRATRVEVQATASAAGIALRIADDGQGFDVNSGDWGTGLASLKARAAAGVRA